jgi:hypothetical protein
MKFHSFLMILSFVISFSLWEPKNSQLLLLQVDRDFNKFCYFWFCNFWMKGISKIQDILNKQAIDEYHTISIISEIMKVVVSSWNDLISRQGFFGITMGRKFLHLILS